MAFRLGILAAIVAYRRRNGKTRLKTLKQQLKKNKNPTVLYQYPAKRIFSIIFLIALMIGIQWLISQVKSDLIQMNTAIPANDSVIIEPIQANKYPIHFSIENHEQRQIGAFDQQLLKINKISYVLHLLLAVAIISLIYNLQVKIVTAKKLEKQIICTNYPLIKPRKIEAIEVTNNDQLVIYEMGDSRITKTDYYFSVRLIGQKKDIQIIKKSCIYDARVAIIKLAHQFQIRFSTKIRKTSQSSDKQSEQ